MRAVNWTALGVGLADRDRDGSTAEPRPLVAGISGLRRHAAVALSRGGALEFVLQQERVTRVRDVGVERGGFPTAALDTALRASGFDATGISELVVGEPGLNGFCDDSAREIDHHHAHAATAFLTSGFRDAAVVVCDTSGTPEVTVWSGSGWQLEPLQFPWQGAGFASVYERMTALLGLPPGAAPTVEAIARLHSAPADGRVADILKYADGALSIGPEFDDYLQAARRGGLSTMAIAAGSVEQRLGDLLLEFLQDVARCHPRANLCVGGGLFFNTYFNSVIRQSAIFQDVHIPVNPGNGGVAAGCALAVGSGPKGIERPPAVPSPFLGPEFTNAEFKAALDNCKLNYAFVDDWQLLPQCVDALGRGELVGWFRGRLEWGPRALGNRSIFANPRAPHVLENLNGFLKQRAAYRTYGLVVRQEDAGRFFDGPSASPYMECDFTMRDPRQFAAVCPPEVTRVRVQTIASDPSPLGDLLSAFGQLTGVPVLVNTSFNGFHEPIVCSPRDAIRVFYGSGIDMLVIGNFLLRK